MRQDNLGNLPGRLAAHPVQKFAGADMVWDARAVLEQMPAAVLITQAPSGRLVLGNQRFATMFGHPFPLPFLGAEWAAVHAAFKGFHVDGRPYQHDEWPLARSLAEGVVILDEEICFIRSDGSKGTVSSSSTPVRNANGCIVAAVATFWDISDRSRAEHALQESERQCRSLIEGAEAASRAKDEFVATVSHELRTPLTAILLWAHILRSHQPADKMFDDGLSTIERAAKAQQQLVDDLLDVSRMSSGKLRLSLRMTRLNAAIEAAIEAVKPVASARGVIVEEVLDENVGLVRVDPDRLQQVIWNLLSNAVKFTPSDGKVIVRSKRQDSHIEISVADTGIGVKPEFLPFLFDRFRQAQVGTTREHAGLGLGLAIVKQLVELHGGTITCMSDGEGKGTTCTIRLPIRQPDETEERSRSASTVTDLTGRQILLVEDEDVTRKAIETLLRKAGANVTAVDSAKAALEMLSMNAFDIVVSDIAMPGTDGYALMRKIRSRERKGKTKPVPALALTAFASAEDRQHALHAGFNEHLSKPIDAEALVCLLIKLLHTAM